ncbi:hypothetical protein OPQ81_009085 [Rhizoctonia solani]|nr:hypothetical protein OPQ81_009085 [Rhizoctonia solani]
MPGSQAPKVRPLTSKPPLTSGRATRSTLHAKTPVAEPLSAPQSPMDSTLPAKTPLNPHATKDFLFKAGFLESNLEISTAALCSSLLTNITAHSEVTQSVCTLIRCVNLLLPEAFALVIDTNTQLSAISVKINTLLSSLQPAPTTPPLPALAELGEKLDKVMSDIQKVAEVWQMVPPMLLCPDPLTPQHPPHCLGSCCYILVKPESDGLKTAFDGLNAHTLTKKAKLAWDAAWTSIKDTDIAKTMKLTNKPRVTFKAMLQLARGGIRYELGNQTQAVLLSDACIATDFEKGFRGASCKGQGATILLQCTPTYYNPEDPVAIPRFKEENGLHRGQCPVYDLVQATAQMQAQTDYGGPEARDEVAQPG